MTIEFYGTGTTNLRLTKLREIEAQGGSNE